MAGLSKSLFKLTLRYMGARRLFRAAAGARKAELSAALEAELGRRVAFGPFAGMILPEASSWGDGDRAVKLTGQYEANLHPWIERMVARRPRLVINVGCAEGFYAIGLARLLPEAKVHAFDIDAAAGRVCRAAAEENGVADRVIVGGECTPALLADLLSSGEPALVFLDCEGAESFLLDPVAVPGLAHADILVECHDFVERGLTAALARRLDGSHAVEVVDQGPRAPHLVPQLAALQELDRWLLVDEGRPESMYWLACLTPGRED